MRIEARSYRFAQEIVEHPNFRAAWDEIRTVLEGTPLFVYPGKSKKHPRHDVVQQVLNTYLDRRFAIDHGWQYHPPATQIPDSNLTADFRKAFGSLTIQAEIQFGNMSRWYSDIFKFQAAYSQGLAQMGLSVVPQLDLARRIDQNIVNFERTWRELPSAELSITLPIILIGLLPDENTTIVDISRCRFASIKQITGGGNAENRWRIVHGYLNGQQMETIGPDSPTGPMLAPLAEEDGNDAADDLEG